MQHTVIPALEMAVAAPDADFPAPFAADFQRHIHKGGDLLHRRMRFRKIILMPDVEHPFVYVDIGTDALRVHSRGQFLGVVQQHLLTAHMDKGRGKSGKIAVQRRNIRVTHRCIAGVQPGRAPQLIHRQQRIDRLIRAVTTACHRQIGPRRNHYQRCRQFAALIAQCHRQ